MPGKRHTTTLSLPLTFIAPGDPLKVWVHAGAAASVVGVILKTDKNSNPKAKKRVATLNHMKPLTGHVEASLSQEASATGGFKPSISNTLKTQKAQITVINCRILFKLLNIVLTP